MSTCASSSIVLRFADLGDVDALAAMHVQSWREAYRDILPDSVLADLDPAARAFAWRETMGRGAAVTLALLAGRIVGFAGCGKRRDPDLGFPGEIYGIYVLACAQRRGLGRRLMAAAAARLLDRGFATAGLWVFAANRPARRFYERLGGRVCAQGSESVADGVFPTVAYGWDDVCALLTEGGSASP